MAVLSINITTLKTVLAALGYRDIKKLSSDSFGVVVPKTKVDKLIPELHKAFRAYNPRIVSDRELRVGAFSLFAKNREQQRGLKQFTVGRGNEWNFVTAIREWLNDYGRPLTINFMDPHKGKVLTAKRVTKVEHTGAKNIFARLKADVHLIDEGGKRVPLSLKDESAGYWESADSYWGPKSAKFLEWVLQHAHALLEDNGTGGFAVRPAIALPATQEETRDVVFGTDIYGKGAVLMKKFTPDSFVWDSKKDVLNVQCKEVITHIEHVRGNHEVYFEIRNERGRNPKHLQKGLRTMATMKSNLRGNKIFSASDRAQIGI